MPNNLALVFDLVAIDRASEVFRRVGDSAGEAGAKVEASTTHMSNAGSKIAAGLGVAAAAAAVLSVKMAGDFQSATTRLVTSAGESEKNLGMVRQGLLDLMGSVGYSSDELTKAMYKVESGGQHGADGLMVLKAAAQGAKTENADLTTVADAVTSAMQDYHLKASDAADVTSKLVAATASGKMTFEELSSSLSSILPVASANHVSLNDILGDLASMTVHGMTAQQATQNLADAVNHVANIGPLASKELAAIGINSTDLTAKLGERGLFGSLKLVADTIQERMGPESTRVVLNLNDALVKLPKPVQEFARGLLDGTKTVGDFRAEIKGLSPEQAAALTGFEGLITSTHQLGAETKSGAEVYQSYSGALRTALGDATTAKVALMLTGENAKTTAGAIKAVSDATADANHNVAGWDLIQGNFNQKLSETKGHLQAMAIEAGTHLLPALTSALDFINRDALPGIQHLGSGIADAVKWFQGLPGPVKDVAEALAVLRVAEMVGLFDKFGASVGNVRAAFKGFGEEMALQRALLAMEQNAGNAEASFGRLGATGTVAMSKLKAAGSGLMDLFGGPWGVTIAGATAAIGLLDSAIQHNTDQIEGWGKALAKGGQAAADATKEMNQAPSAWDRFSFALTHAGNSIGQIGTQTREAEQAQRDYINSLGPTEKAAALVSKAEAQLAYDIQKHGKSSQQVKIDTENYNAQLIAQQILSKNVSEAEQTQIDKTNQLANAQLASVSSSLGAAQANAQLANAIAQYNADANDGKHTVKQLADESNNLAMQAIQTAQAAGRQATAQAKANGITDDGTLANKAIYESLKRAAEQITGPGHDALALAMTDLQKTTLGSGTLADTVSKMGATLAWTWDNNTVVLKSATDQQIRDLEALGYTVKTLPNGKVVVTADTGPAAAQMQALVDSYRNYSININPQGMALTTEQRNTLYSGGRATGGPIYGPGSGTSDTAGLFALSNGEHVWTAAEVTAAGGHSGVESLRKAVLASGRGLAAGGGVVTESARFSDAYIATAQALIAKMGAMGQANVAAAASGAGGAARWSGLVLQALGIEGQPSSLLGSVLRRMNMESGGNQYAINLSDSNAAAGTPSKGLMQVIDPTFRAYHHPGTSWDIYDPMANVLSSMDYAIARYGSLPAAYDRVGGYKLGTNFVPSDQLAFLHKGEAVVPASQNQGSPYQSGGPAVFHLYDADNVLIGTMRGHAEEATGRAVNTLYHSIAYGG